MLTLFYRNIHSKFKSIVYNFLCNALTGSLIYYLFNEKIPDLRWSGFKFKMPKAFTNRQIVASIFWGFYESAEIRHIEKYLRDDLDVIELGSSLGIVTSHIASKLGTDMHLIALEANPFLIETISENIKRHNNGASTFEVLNFAICYDSDEVMISISSNTTETHVVKNEHSNGTVKVRAMSFGDLIKRRTRQVNYALVCDIEGSELEIILHEKEALLQCTQLFIELHDIKSESRQYSVQQLKNELLNLHGFKIIQEHGPVIYLEKP